MAMHMVLESSSDNAVYQDLKEFECDCGCKFMTDVYLTFKGYTLRHTIQTICPNCKKRCTKNITSGGTES